MPGAVSVANLVLITLTLLVSATGTVLTGQHMLVNATSSLTSVRLSEGIEIRPQTGRANILSGYMVVELVQADMTRGGAFSDYFGREKFEDWEGALKTAEEAFDVDCEFTTSGKNLAVRVYSRRPGRVASVVQYILHGIQERER